jgi:hypothetical protein
MSGIIPSFYFLRWSLLNFFLWLASKLDPPDLCLPSIFVVVVVLLYFSDRVQHFRQEDLPGTIPLPTLFHVPCPVPSHPPIAVTTGMSISTQLIC